MKRISLLSFFNVMLLVGCATVPTKDITVDTRTDPKAYFSGYKSYYWLDTAAILNDPYGQWEPPNFDADSEVKYLIDRELRKRGMTQNSVDPDIIVTFAAGIKLTTLALKVDPKTNINSLVYTPRGGLLIALVNSKSGFVIWKGIATADIQKQPDAKTVKARLDYAVTELFRVYPN